MRELIPFSKEIVFKTNIACITSISLEHEEKVFDGEITGDFIVFGDYKVHNDTTEKELFKYRLPFTAIIPDDILKDSVVVNVEEFTYEIIEEDVIRINIEFSIQGDKIEVLNEEEIVTENDVLCEPLVEIQNENSFNEDFINDDLRIDNEIEDILNLTSTGKNINEKKEIINVIPENIDIFDKNKVDIEENIIVDDVKVIENKKEVINEEYVTYHVHIVRENETLENILKMYNGNLECIKEYNEINDLKVGDKVIIPEYVDE